MIDQCQQCGYGPAAQSPSVAEKRHKAHHDPWANGVPLPPDIPLPDNGVLRVPANGAKPHVGLACKMARVAQMGLGGSFASFNLTPVAARTDWETNHAIAYLAIRDDAVIGYLVTRARTRWGVVNLDDPEGEVMLTEHEQPRPCLDLAFVSGGFRRQGIATSLVELAAIDQGLPAGEFLHLLPWSPDGRAFAERFSGDRRLLVT